VSEAITVQGVGRVEARPDVAMLELGSEARAESVEQALSAASQALTTMVAALHANGATETDLRTEGPSTYTVTDDVGRVNSYVCSFRLTARVSDPARAGLLLADCVAQAGDGARVHGVNYTLRDRAEHQRQARVLAVADARARAEQLAELVGRPVGRATNVTESSSQGGPIRPMGRTSLGSDSTDLEPGVEQVTVCVEVTWVFAD
jgi:uncharacterized protein YggE